MSRLRAWMVAAWHWTRDIPHRLAAIPESPHEIAKAFAIGVFLGIIPGTGAAVALLIAIFFKLSKTAAVLGALVTNPWTVAFFYAMSYKVGILFTRLEEPILWKSVLTFEEDWGSEILRATPTLLIGAAVLGLAVAGTSYLVVRCAVAQYRKTRLKHHVSPSEEYD